MRHTLTIALMALAMSSLARAATLEPAPLPASIRETVQSTYHFGRETKDYGGVSAIEVFDVADSSDTRDTAIELLSLLQELNPELASLCAGLQGECATQALRRAERASAVTFLSELIADFEGAWDADSFLRGLGTLRRFISETSGTRPQEWSLRIDAIRSLSLIVDQPNRRAIAVFYDFGAQ
jgi:hypothetical protein